MSRTYKDTQEYRDFLTEKFGGWLTKGGVPSWFKVMRVKIRRAKEKQALRINKEIPFFRKDDEWDWY